MSVENLMAIHSKDALKNTDVNLTRGKLKESPKSLEFHPWAAMNVFRKFHGCPSSY